MNDELFPRLVLGSMSTANGFRDATRSSQFSLSLSLSLLLLLFLLLLLLSLSVLRVLRKKKKALLSISEKNDV